MNLKRAKTMAGVSACALAASIYLAGCASAPKPAEADGSSRVPANDPARVQALQQRVHADRALLTENNLLRAQVDMLQTKLTEMTTIVREALTLPPAPRPLPSPLPSTTEQRGAVQKPTSMASLPPRSFEQTSTGAVFRVFHPFARTEFNPSTEMADTLRNSVRGAQRIEVRGHTDSNVVNQVDRLIAMERAEKARIWLIENGTDGSKIQTKYFTAGRFLTENRTKAGRAMNRRVEIDIQNSHLADKQVALNR